MDMLASAILRPYYPDLEELCRAVTAAEQAAAGRRRARRLKRKRCLYETYIALLATCCPAIHPYHANPVGIVNRFWSRLDISCMLLNDSFPEAADFFTWYCDSKTIAAEGDHIQKVIPDAPLFF